MALFNGKIVEKYLALNEDVIGISISKAKKITIKRYYRKLLR